jgi:hypothetical protein
MGWDSIRRRTQRTPGAQRDDVVVGATVAHHADALHRQEDGEGLARQVVPVPAAGGVDGRA